MRFLRLLITYLVLGGLGLGVAVFLVMYGVSFSQATKLSASLSQAKQLSRRPIHAEDCLLIEEDEEYPLLGYQLRFINSKEYVVEAVCNSSVKGPFEVVRKKLGLGVVKEDGYSGVLYPIINDGEIDARVAVRLGYASWLLDASAKARVSMQPMFGRVSVDPGSLSARAACEGWGYQCCNNLTQVGVGEVVKNQILSCHDSCFATCLERPSILIFSTEPEMNSSTRELVVRRGEGVIFSYSVQDVDSEGVRVTIDFGDGQNATSTNQNDQFSHNYVCSQGECVYSATLSVVDVEGLENSRSRIGESTVRVR